MTECSTLTETTHFLRTFVAKSKITSLAVHLGAVYITADASITHATACLRYDSPDLLDAFHISEGRHEWTLGWTYGKRAKGRYMIELRLPPRMLECVSFTAPGVMSISSGVVASSPSVHLSIHSSGPGQLIIQENQLVARGLTLWHTGSGSVQLISPISVDVVDITSRGRGIVAVVASTLTTSDFSIANHSYGTIYLKAPTHVFADDVRVVNDSHGAVNVAFDSLTTDQLTLVVGSSGPIFMSIAADLSVAMIDTRMSSSGSLQLTCSEDGSTCDRHQIAMSGSGDLCTNVSAVSTQTNVSGSGCVRDIAPCTLQSFDRIKSLPLRRLLAA
ncbi:unnamed protein product [Aphanomyces euteiches]|nr:hypothetical protein AeRB84_015992 [Aphanomyces euteiches]